MQFLDVELFICPFPEGWAEEGERNMWHISTNPPFTFKKLLAEIINFIFLRYVCIPSVPPHPTGAVSCEIEQTVWLHLVSWSTLQTAGGEAGGKGWAPTGKQKVVEVEALGFTERGWIAPSRRKIALTYWKQGEYSCFRSLQHGWFVRATNRQELEKVADWW